MTAIDFAANDKTCSRSDALAQSARVLGALMFPISVAALIGQLTWQHVLVRRFGNDAELVTILVVTLGLGLGALFGGVLSRRRIAPLPLMSLLAAASGGCAFLAPLNARGWGIAVAPCLSALLMGATLPVAVGHLVRRSGAVGSALGEILFVSLAGAGAACLACIAVLFSLLSERGALDAAAAIYAVVAIGALAMRWRGEARTAHAYDTAPVLERQPSLAFLPVLALAAAAGFLALSYVLFFARIVSYAAPSNTVLFATTLGTFLIGLAVGARRAGTHCALFSAEEQMRRAARSVMAMNLVGLAALPLLEQLAWLDRAVIVLAMLLCFLVASACGALMPYLAELSVPANTRAGQRCALICVAHIVGAAAGALLTGLVLMDRLSLVAIGVMLVVAGALLALFLAGILDLPRWQKIVRGATAIAVVALALTLLPHWSANVVERLSGKAPAPAEPVVQTIGQHALGPASKVAARRITG